MCGQIKLRVRFPFKAHYYIIYPADDHRIMNRGITQLNNKCRFQRHPIVAINQFQYGHQSIKMRPCNFDYIVPHQSSSVAFEKSEKISLLISSHHLYNLIISFQKIASKLLNLRITQIQSKIIKNHYGVH